MTSKKRKRRDRERDSRELAARPSPAAASRSEARPGPSDRRVALLLALLAFLVYNANLRPVSTGDSLPARFLPFTLWTEGSLYLDSVRDVTVGGHPAPYWILASRDGHIASMYPVVVPILVAPLYAPAVLYLEIRGWTDERLARVGALMEKLASSVLASVCAGLMYLALRRRSPQQADRRTAVLLTLAFAFATNAWVTGSQALWQHGAAQLFLAVALLCMTGRPSWPALIAAGAACGLLVANRLLDAPLAAAFVAWSPFWARRRWPAFAAAAAVPVALLVYYNLSTFGLLGGGYAIVRMATNAQFFSLPALPGLAGLLVNPGKGLFVFSPFLIFLPVYFRRALADERHRLLTLCLAAGVVLELLVYCKTDWRAGFSYGPRFLSSMLPVLIWLLAPVVAALGRTGRTVFLALVLVGVWAQVVGAFFYQGKSDGIYYSAPAGEPLRETWRWRNIPYVLELEAGRAPATLDDLVRAEAGAT